MSNIDEIAHKLANLTNTLIKLKLSLETENDDGAFSTRVRIATHIMTATMEWMKEVSRHEPSELTLILQTMANQQHEYAVEFMCHHLGIEEYGIIRSHPDHSLFTFTQKW